MSIYQHFRKEEAGFIDQILKWCEMVKNQYTYKLTDFLDPREQQIIQMIIGNDDEIKVDFFGGNDRVERKRAMIYPSFFQIGKDDFNLTLFEIKYPAKFTKIQHPQVLGSLLSLGLKRGKFGDIVFHDDRIQFVLATEVADYVRLHLQKIGKTSIQLVEVPFEKMLTNIENWLEEVITISSMRLDVILSQVYHISRQKIQVHIQSELVKVNWKIVSSTSFECQEGDMISARGLGRLKIISIEGKTKKDKIRMIVAKQK